MTKSTIHHSFDPYLAREYGLEEAILIQHFQFWIQLNIEKNKNFHDGRYWTYQTHEDISAHFPYLSKDQVNRTLRNLVEKKVIVKGNYNKTQFDRTSWYAFEDQENFLKLKNKLPNGEIAKSDLAKSPNGKSEIATPIPDTKKDIRRNNKKDVVVVSSKKDKNQALNALAINHHLKKKVCETLSFEDILLLIKRVKRWIDRESDAKACNTILKKWPEWDDTPTKKEQVQNQQDEISKTQEKVEKKREHAKQIFSKDENITVSDNCIQIISKTL